MVLYKIITLEYYYKKERKVKFYLVPNMTVRLRGCNVTILWYFC